jgi:acetyl-CoA C-acetyltransferase
VKDACIIDCVRTPRGKGKPGGALHSVHPQDLLGQCLNELVARVGFDPAEVDDIVVGVGVASADHDNIGRLAPLAAGWPVSSPGVIVSRLCGSGQQAITFAAMGIMSGMQDLVVAGGVESMSRWPIPTGPPLIDGGNPAFRARYPTVPQGISADLIATLEEFTRHDCDALALESQERAAKAIAEGRFDRSMITVRHSDGSVALDHEEHPRPGTTLDSLATLRPAFQELGAAVIPPMDHSLDEVVRSVYPQVGTINHVHHAGNSSGVVDGAAALLLAGPDVVHAHGLKPRARIRMTAVRGADPVIMLTAPAPAAKLCLDKAGMTTADIDLWEINEAFAAVVIKACRDLDLSGENVNVNGGAIALGHPIGASGAILIGTALDELERRDEQTALITICTGGGMATATIIERI